MVRPVKRRLAALFVTPLLALPLVSCSVDDIAEFMGPGPDERILELANRAAGEGTRLDGEAAQVRGRHAEELSAEIVRLCGTRPDGSLPQSCEFGLTPTDEEISLEDSLTVTLDAVRSGAPAESRALLVRQAVDIAGLTTDPDPSLTPPERPDLDAARDLLSREYATAWGLGIAQAFLEGQEAADIEDRLDEHEVRISALRALFEDTTGDADVPVAEPGYEIEGIPSPTDPASARAFVSTLQKNLAVAWMEAAVDAKDPGWREFTVRGAALAEAPL